MRVICIIIIVRQNIILLILYNINIIYQLATEKI